MRSGSWIGRGAKRTVGVSSIAFVTLLGHVALGWAEAPQSFSKFFDPNSVERALASFDVDAKFAALSVVQQGMANRVVHVELLFVSDSVTTKELINLSFAFEVSGELSDRRCVELNWQLQKEILSGYWREIPGTKLTDIGPEEQSANSARANNLPVSDQLDQIMRRFAGFAKDPTDYSALSPFEFASLKEKHIPAYNALRFYVSLIATDEAANPNNILCTSWKNQYSKRI